MLLLIIQISWTFCIVADEQDELHDSEDELEAVTDNEDCHRPDQNSGEAQISLLEECPRSDVQNQVKLTWRLVICLSFLSLALIILNILEFR